MRINIDYLRCFWRYKKHFINERGLIVSMKDNTAVMIFFVVIIYILSHELKILIIKWHLYGTYKFLMMKNDLHLINF